MTPVSGSDRRLNEVGYSLVELMVALVINLLILLALITLFVSNSKSRDSVERLGIQIENGRYASEVIALDLKNAGYLGPITPNEIALAFSGAPDPCAVDINSLSTNMQVHVQGFDDLAGDTGCLNDVKPGTDALVIRRVSTCYLGETGCGAVSGATYLRASLCASEIANGKRFEVGTSPSSMTLTKRDCVTKAETRRLVTHIYFVSKNPSDGIPTLKRAELRSGKFEIFSVAQGVENLQIQYGLDDSPAAGLDGIPDQYSANPGEGCSGADCALPWMNVVSVKLVLLARSTNESSDYVDEKIYSFGYDSNGAPISEGPFKDGFRRAIHSQQIFLNNVAGRREKST
jgi:type IV pilus assembly protein PilW